MKWYQFEDGLMLKLAAAITAVGIMLRPLKTLFTYLWNTKERVDKLDEIHKEVTAEGGMTKRHLELTESVRHIEALTVAQMDMQALPQFICDNTGRNFYVNYAYAKLFKVSKDALMDYSWKDHLFTPEYGQYVEERMSEGRNIHYEFEKYLVSMIPIILKTGKPGYVGTIETKN
jgi:PAS domain-containing protein